MKPKLIFLTSVCDGCSRLTCAVRKSLETSSTLRPDSYNFDLYVKLKLLAEQTPFVFSLQLLFWSYRKGREERDVFQEWEDGLEAITLKEKGQLPACRDRRTLPELAAPWVGSPLATALGLSSASGSTVYLRSCTCSGWWWVFVDSIQDPA